MSIFNAARDLASLGLSVVPVAGKKPVVPWGRFAVGRERPTPAEMRAWLARPGVTGIGVLCGPASGGLTIADFDDNGAYRVWRRGFPDVAELLPVVRTRRGAHVWFRSKLAKSMCRDWGELKASGIVVCPPSMHPDGGEYAWLSEPPRWDIPFIEPEAVGLLGHATEDVTQKTCDTEATEDDFCGIPSASSVSLPGDCLPRRLGERNRAVWRLVQVLRGDPRLSGLPCDHAEVVARFDAWHTEAARVVGTPDRATSWRDFERGWASCRFPRGSQLVRVARRVPAGAAALDRVRAVCAAFSAEAGGGVFYLSCRTAEQLTGIDYKSAARYLRDLVRLRELVLVEKGKTPRASRYKLGTLEKKIARDI